jgi:hypothetical protein
MLSLMLFKALILGIAGFGGYVKVPRVIRSKRDYAVGEVGMRGKIGFYESFQ